MFGKHVDKKLSAYLHGELSADDARRVAEHLRACRRCRVAYEEIEFGAQMAAQLKHEAAPASLWRELEAALEQPPTRAWQWLWPTHWSRLAFVNTAILLLLGVGALWIYLRMSRPQWEVTRLAGAPQIGERAIGNAGRLSVGEWLRTDESSRARISVGGIGSVECEPNTELQLLAARATEHRLALKRGKMKAVIKAPPKLFYVNTPSATAVDLGCAYTLEVDDAGTGTLHVSLGWVAFEWRGIESFVPAGARCITRPELGPGTPHYDDASTRLQTALAQFDTAQTNIAARAAALAEVLATARTEDAITLWHLLTRTHDDERGQVYDRFAMLIPLRSSVTRDGVLRGDHAMLDALWDQLGLDSARWWRIWKGPVPTTK